MDFRSANACEDSPPYVEKGIWCPFRDRGNPFVTIRPRLMSRRPLFNDQIRWQNQVAVGLTPSDARRRRQMIQLTIVYASGTL